MLGCGEWRCPPKRDELGTHVHAQLVLYSTQLVAGSLDRMRIEQRGEQFAKQRRVVTQLAERVKVLDRPVDERVLASLANGHLAASCVLDQSGDVVQPPAVGGAEHEFVGDTRQPWEDLEGQDVHALLAAVPGQGRERPRTVGQRRTYSPQHGGLRLVVVVGPQGAPATFRGCCADVASMKTQPTEAASIQMTSQA